MTSFLMYKLLYIVGKLEFPSFSNEILTEPHLPCIQTLFKYLGILESEHVCLRLGYGGDNPLYLMA